MPTDALDWQQASTTAHKGQRNEMRMIARAAEVMRALAEMPTGLSLGQLAKSTGLARSTVQRLIGALEVEGFVSTKAGQVGAKLGFEVFRLGATAMFDVRALFRTQMEMLQADVGETVELTRLTDSGPVVIDQITSSQPLRLASYVGRKMPFHCTASGKAHLMVLTLPQAKRVLPKVFERHTSNTLTAMKDVLNVVNINSPHAFAYERDEFILGASALAVPITVPGGESYALAMSMPSSRFADHLQKSRDALRHCQQAIEAAAVSHLL